MRSRHYFIPLPICRQCQIGVDQGHDISCSIQPLASQQRGFRRESRDQRVKAGKDDNAQSSFKSDPEASARERFVRRRQAQALAHNLPRVSNDLGRASMIIKFWSATYSALCLSSALFWCLPFYGRFPRYDSRYAVVPFTSEISSSINQRNGLLRRDPYLPLSVVIYQSEECLQNYRLLKPTHHDP